MSQLMYQQVEGVLGIRQTSSRDWITARAPDGSEQRFFDIPHNATVFEVFRIAFDHAGKAFRVAVTVFPADRNQFIVNVGNLPEPQYEND
jgi:GntR family transcriptional regulator